MSNGNSVNSLSFLLVFTYASVLACPLETSAAPKIASKRVVGNSIKSFSKVFKSSIDRVIAKDLKQRKTYRPGRPRTYLAESSVDPAAGGDSSSNEGQGGAREFSTTIQCPPGTASISGVLTPSQNPYGSDISAAVVYDNCGQIQSGSASIESSARYSSTSFKRSSHVSGDIAAGDCGQGVAGSVTIDLKFDTSLTLPTTQTSFSTFVSGSVDLSCGKIPLLACTFDHIALNDPNLLAGCKGLGL